LKRIHLISGPRNVSTALMYSFGNREDCSVLDEPFYAYYLNNHPDIYHPGRKEILESQAINFEEVLEDVIFNQYPDPLVFIKNMAHHMDNTNWSFMSDLSNVLLIRNPRDLIASFAKVIENPSLLDIGLRLEFEILEYLLENKMDFTVLDSGDILEDPLRCLSALCKKNDIPFSDKMLQWVAGPRKEDGVWAKYWYSNVHKSTGFAKKKISDHEFPKHLEGLLEEAQYYYNRLSQYKLSI